MQNSDQFVEEFISSQVMVKLPENRASEFSIKFKEAIKLLDWKQLYRLKCDFYSWILSDDRNGLVTHYRWKKPETGLVLTDVDMIKYICNSLDCTRKGIEYAYVWRVMIGPQLSSWLTGNPYTDYNVGRIRVVMQNIVASMTQPEHFSMIGSIVYDYCAYWADVEIGGLEALDRVAVKLLQIAQNINLTGGV